MNFAVFSCINIEFTSIKQLTSDKQRSDHKNVCFKFLVHIFKFSCLILTCHHMRFNFILP